MVESGVKHNNPKAVPFKLLITEKLSDALGQTNYYTITSNEYTAFKVEQNCSNYQTREILPCDET